MNTYIVGYCDYEESPEIYLTHGSEFTQEQFEDLASDVSVNIINSREDEDLDFSDIISEVVKTLIDDFGFKRLKATACFDPTGFVLFSQAKKHHLANNHLIKIQEKWEKKKSL